MEVFFIKNSSPFSFASWSLYKSNEPGRRIESCQFMVLRFPHSSLTLYLQLIILKCFKKLLTALKSKLKMIFVVCWQFVFSQLHWNVNKSSDDTDFFISFIWQAIIDCCFRSLKADKKSVILRYCAAICASIALLTLTAEYTVSLTVFDLECPMVKRFTSVPKWKTTDLRFLISKQNYWNDSFWFSKFSNLRLVSTRINRVKKMFL